MSSEAKTGEPRRSLSLRNDTNDYALNSEGFLESESVTESSLSTVTDEEKLIS